MSGLQVSKLSGKTEAEKRRQGDHRGGGGLGYPLLAPLRLVPLGATAFVVLLLVTRAVIYLQNALEAVRYPFGLDYGEGIVLQQVLLTPGAHMYGAITDAPYIVFNYPPIYHLAVRLAMLLGFDPLMAGRGLSVACTLV